MRRVGSVGTDRARSKSGMFDAFGFWGAEEHSRDERPVRANNAGTNGNRRKCFANGK